MKALSMGPSAAVKAVLICSRSLRGFRQHCQHLLILNWFLLGGIILDSHGAEISEVYGFENYYNPSSLLLAADGALYGTVSGALNTGMVFRVTLNGGFTSFAGLTPTNATPYEGGPLVQDGNGDLYGASYGGGAYNYGSIFRVSSNGIVTRLVSFTGTNGARPFAGLTSGSDGNFYGTTAYGGPNYRGAIGGVLLVPGTVFKVDTNGTLTTLVAFNRTNGASPEAQLLLGADGAFYGITISGGGGGAGTIFRMTIDGTLNTLVAFGGTNGAAPYGGLVQTPDGTFYGTTSHGGATDYGTLFSLRTNGEFTTLASFTGTNGAYPYAGLIQGSDGALYGTTQYGGFGFDGSQNSGKGSVFRLLDNGEVLTLGALRGTNGAGPVSGLAQGPDGYLYGTCNSGGSHGAGNVFRIANRILLRITIQPDGARSLNWNAVSGMSYRSQFCSGLNSAQWKDIGVSVLATNDAMNAVDSLIGDAQRFYRIVESRPTANQLPGS
jgi:uncharacterized repeat protein (TIGR03803 family)